MLFKLSLKNIKKSIKDYSIYFFTLVVAVTIFYIFNSLGAQESMLKLTASKKEIIETLVRLLGYISIFVSAILGFLIIYTNNFIIKRRKKEFGLYLTLGMSKRKVSTILVIETLVVGLISLTVGLICGIGLSQFLSIITAKLFEADMSKYQFFFSNSAVMKTIFYFGIVFILVMIFNVISLSRYKLIDLLNAKHKNEKIRFHNKYTTFIAIVLALVMLIYAYKSLFAGELFNFNGNTLKMLICGVLGTFFLFFSISGLFLKIAQFHKQTYYKGLNMFVLKQVNSRVNTTVISTTIISLMLLLTIGILSGSMSLISVYNGGLRDNNLTDFTINNYNTVYKVDGNITYVKQDTSSFVSDITNNQEFKNDVSSYISYNLYSDPSITFNSMIDKNTKKEIIKKYGASVSLNGTLEIIAQSDYNKIMALINRHDLTINLKDNKYILTANVDGLSDYYKPNYQNGKEVTIGGVRLQPATKKIVNIALQNYNGDGNIGTIIVPDKVLTSYQLERSVIIGYYHKVKDINTLDSRFTKNLGSTINTSYNIITKISMEDSSVGIKAIVTFIGLYLGIIFAISSATVLAIGQLSESSDNKERFKVLKQIGADETMIKKALLTQIAIAFLLPLVVALFHAYFGLRELNSIMELLGNINLTSNIFITTLFIVIVYGGYFVATYLCSKNIIKD